MKRLRNHLHDKLLAGILAAGPLVVIIGVAVWLEQQTHILTQPLYFHFPGLGVLIAILAIYLLGLLVTSLLGRLLLRLADRVLGHVPLFNMVYKVWKDIVAGTSSKAGMFHHVVLLPHAAGDAAQIGFTSGEPLPGDCECICVFLPNIPNPLTGRLVVVKQAVCHRLDVSVDEALKFLLSMGNYRPAALRGDGVPQVAV